MTELIRSHREVRAVIRLSGRLIEKRMLANPNAQKPMLLMKRELKESRQVESAARA
jgi:hypothetical protein